MSLAQIDEFKCNECGDDGACVYYQCACCDKPMCSVCIACIEGDVGTSENPKEQKRICIECYKITSVRNCNDCHKLRRCEFSTCWTCHKTDICDDCITMYRYDDWEELYTVCSQAKEENEEKRVRAYREESEKRKAEHRRNYPHLFSNLSSAL